MKTTILILLIAPIFMCATCEQRPPSSDEILQNKTETAMKEATSQIGLPAIKNFQEKKLMKQIYELRDQENLICYAYLFNRNNGKVGDFLGKCLGYGLPYSTQFSNPSKLVPGDVGQYTGDIPLPQAEPNGLFMPDGLAATWLLLLDKEGNPHPVYVEPEIIVSPFPLHK